MAEIYLVRHGQASFNSKNYDRLSDLGKQQSEYLGQYFTERDIAFDHIFTGTQLRHKQTADGIIGKKTNSYSVLSGLNEYNFSALYKAYMRQHPEEEEASRGGNRRIFYQRLKLALKLWAQDKLTGDLPESWAEFKSRVGDALAHIRETSDGKCLVVSSGGSISMAIGLILDLEPQKIIELNLQIKNASFCHIYLGRGTMKLSSFNNIPHLDQQGRFDAITFS
ncbi:MAG: histidine phosphatase family protein [Emcibacter sp.]|nr:histidine phosphatase family protein [Emcibacter sp.]